MKKQIFAAAIFVQILVLCGLVYFLFLQQGVKWQINEKDGTVLAESTIYGTDSSDKINTALNAFYAQQLANRPDTIYNITETQNDRNTAILQITALSQEKVPQKSIYDVWVILNKANTQIIIKNALTLDYTDIFYNEAIK